MAILMIHGPRSEGSGMADLDAVQASLDTRAKAAGHVLTRHHCGTEQQLLERLARINREEADIILLDAGRCTRIGPPLRDALARLDVPYIEVRDEPSADPAPPTAGHPGPRLGVVDGYAAQGYTLAMSMALETLGCAESENEFHVGT